MVEDPGGHKVEWSTEFQHIAHENGRHAWKCDERALNYWGQSWTRRSLRTGRLHKRARGDADNVARPALTL